MLGASSMGPYWEVLVDGGIVRTARIGLLLCSQIFCSLLFGQETAKAPTAKVTGGEIRGLAISGGGAVFRGIPFAQPPVGDLRWRGPQPVKPWDNLRAAVVPAPPCIQPSLGWNNEFAAAGREDCLYLDVWTPEWPAKRALPVMVWLHGGANMGGAGGFDPLYEGYSLIRHGVVLVVIQYRLGVFGFLAHPELTRESAHHASGNYAILDQIAALKWVHENIATFGGDPSNVTIFGQSAGSMDAMALMTTPLSEGFFERAIGESGAIISGGINSLAVAEQIGASFAAKLHAPVKNPIAYLRSLPAEKLKSVDAAKIAAVTVDGWVFPQSPAGVFATGKEQHLPMLVGSNAVEFPMPGTPAYLRKWIEAAYPDIAAKALTLYGLDRPSGSAAPDPIYGNVNDQVGSDGFRCAVVAEGMWHSTAGNPTWEYQFDRAIPPHPKTAHSGELAYVFGNLRPTGSQAGDFDAVDRKISSAIETYWSNFAKTGNPNGKGLTDWPKFNNQSREYLDFASDGSLVVRENQRGPYCDLLRKHWKNEHQ